MNTADYLKQASSSLQQAATAARADIDELTRMIAARDTETKDHLDELKRREAQRLSEASTSDSDRVSAAALTSARDLRAEESKVKDNFSRQKQALDDRLAARQQSLDQMNQLVRQINQILAQIDAPLNI